jgi:hypothetical protein
MGDLMTSGRSVSWSLNTQETTKSAAIIKAILRAMVINAQTTHDSNKKAKTRRK